MPKCLAQDLHTVTGTGQARQCERVAELEFCLKGGQQVSRLMYGITFLREARHIATTEARAALDRGLWNLAARRACDSMEKSVKAVHLLVGEEPPKVHDPPIPRGFGIRVPLVTWYAYADLRDSVTIIVTKDLTPFTLRLFKCVHGTLTHLATAPLPSPVPIGLVVDGSILRIVAGRQVVGSVTDTMAGHPLTQGRWVQLAITEDRLGQIKNAMRKAGKGRDRASYHESDVGSGEARSLVETASSIFGSVKRHVGYNLDGWVE